MLYDVLRERADAAPQSVAQIAGDARISYAKLLAQVDHLAGGLRALDIAPGDRVGLLLPNVPLFTAAYYGVGALGAVVVPANPRLTPPELAYQWGDAAVRAVLTVAPLASGAGEAARTMAS